LRGRPSFSLQDSPTQLWRLKVALGILSQSAFVITKKPFSLAGIVSFANVASRFAGALALACIGTDAVTFCFRGVRRGRHSSARKNEGGSGDGN